MAWKSQGSGSEEARKHKNELHHHSACHTAETVRTLGYCRNGEAGMLDTLPHGEPLANTSVRHSVITGVRVRYVHYTCHITTGTQLQQLIECFTCVCNGTSRLTE